MVPEDRHASRIAQLDVLRAIAVILVIFRHLRCGFEGPGVLNQIGSMLSRGGWAGVDLFFVLSGFLVGGILIREYLNTGSISMSRFLWRRALKIYPPFWLYLLFTFLWISVFDSRPAWKNLLSEGLFLHNYWTHPLADALTMRWWIHTWSLAVEEHFYLLLAAALFFCSRVKRLWVLPTVSILMAGACLYGRFRLQASGAKFDPLFQMFPSHLRMDALFFGVLLALVYQRKRAALLNWIRPKRWPVMIAGMLAFVPAFLFEIEHTPFIYVYGFTLQYLGGGCIVAAALCFPLGQAQGTRWLAKIGARSYSIYLWHMVAESAAYCFDVRPAAYILMSLCGSVALGLLAANAVEGPVIRLRDRFFPARAHLVPTCVALRHAPAVAHLPELQRAH